MRGVHLFLRQKLLCKLGSSPHARGPLDGAINKDSQFRIIPACAGSTAMALAKDTQGRDHPRMRGVHGLARVGSSFL